MALEAYPQEGLQLADPTTSLWRFMRYDRFVELFETRQLYFCRSDKLPGDDQEGLPPEEYLRFHAAQMGPGTSFEGSLQFLREDRQGFFVSCWYTFDHETATMWERYGPAGVAIFTRYGTLEKQLDLSSDRMFFGQVRYGLLPHRFNTLHFITTKRPMYEHEREVRGFIWRADLSPRNPYPHDSPEGLKHSVDLKSMIEAIVVSPEAPDNTLSDIEAVLARLGYSMPVHESSLRPYVSFLPTLDEIERFSSK